MFERFTEHARQVVVLAHEEARMLRHSYIGTEHILLGLLRETDGVAARALDELKVDVDRVRAEIVRMTGPGEDVTSEQFPFTPRAKKVLELSLREALILNHNYIGTEHILLGLVRENEGIASRILLDDFDAEAEKIRNTVVALLATGPQARRTAVDDLRRFGPQARRTGVDDLRGLGPVVSGRDEIAASLTTIIEMLLRLGSESEIPRRRARRLVTDAIGRHDPEAAATLGPAAWHAMVEEILDANPDVARQ